MSKKNILSLFFMQLISSVLYLSAFLQLFSFYYFFHQKMACSVHFIPLFKLDEPAGAPVSHGRLIRYPMTRMWDNGVSKGPLEVEHLEFPGLFAIHWN